MRRLLLAGPLICVLLGACGRQPEEAAVAPVVTGSPIPTFAIPPSWTAAPTNTPGPTDTPEPTATPEPTVSPLDALRVALEDELSVGTRDAPRLARLENSPMGTLYVDWNINDYLSEDGLQRNGGVDIVNLLRTIAEHGKGLEYNDVSLSGFFPLVDESGNARDAMVVQVWYDRSVVEATDWPGAYDRIYTLAKTVRMHDVFKE